MYQNDAEMLFPARVIPELEDLRGDPWRKLVKDIATLPETDARSLAFSLMMIRLDGCLTCQCDSYRAMRGCTLCAKTTIGRFKGNDRELLKKYKEAQADVEAYFSNGHETLEG
jgi:hypothetical protein